MENKNMIVLGGGAAACFVLGYLGLHFMGGESIDDPDIEKRIENNEPNNENQKVNIIAGPFAAGKTEVVRTRLDDEDRLEIDLDEIREMLLEDYDAEDQKDIQKDN